MKKFKVGDRARLVHSSSSFVQLVGKVVEIVSVGSFLATNGNTREYVIEFEDGTKPSDFHLTGTGWIVDGYQLEPIVDLGSWSELESAINWNPFKTVENTIRRLEKRRVWMS